MDCTAPRRNRAQLAALQYAQQQLPQAEASYRANYRSLCRYAGDRCRNLLRAYLARLVAAAATTLQRNRTRCCRRRFREYARHSGRTTRDTSRALWGGWQWRRRHWADQCQSRSPDAQKRSTRRAFGITRSAGDGSPCVCPGLTQGRRASELTLYRQSVPQLTSCSCRRAASTMPAAKSISHVQPVYQELVGLLAALHRQQPDAADREALAVISTTQNRLFTEMLRQLDVKQLADDKAFQQWSSASKEQKNRLAETRRARIELSGSGEDDATMAATNPIADPLIASASQPIRAELKAEQQALEQALNRTENQLWAGYPRYMELTQPRPVTADMLQSSCCASNETLISYYLLPQQVAIFVVSLGVSSCGWCRWRDRSWRSRSPRCAGSRPETDGTPQSLADSTRHCCTSCTRSCSRRSNRCSRGANCCW